MVSTRYRVPKATEKHVLDRVRVRLISSDDTLERERIRERIEKHHYLKSDALVGEQLRYVAELGGQSPQGSRAMDRLGHSAAPPPSRAGRQQRPLPHPSR